MIQEDLNSNQITLSYEEERLVKVSSINGHFNFTYENGKIKTINDHVGRMVTFTYDDDLLMKTEDKLGNGRTYTYDDKGRFISETNPEGNLVVKNEYDERERVIKQTFADNGIIRYLYDEEAKTTECIEQNGASTIYERDDVYRTTGVAYPDGGKERVGFNEDDQKVYTADRVGNMTHYEYDEKRPSK